MAYEQRPVVQSVLVCDICGEPLEESTYSGGQDHRAQVTREAGSVTRGYIAHPVTNLTRRAWLMWPPPSWKRKKPYNERPRDVTYEMHGSCVVALVEKAIEDRKSSGSRCATCGSSTPSIHNVDGTYTCPDSFHPAQQWSKPATPAPSGSQTDGADRG